MSQDLENWFDQSIMQQSDSMTCRQKISGGLGYFSGIVSAAWTAPLAFAFGETLVADILGVEDRDGKHALGYFFATFSLPASAILFSRVTNFVLIALSAPPKPEFPNVIKKINPKLVRAYQFLGSIFAAINATPPAYLTYVFLHNLIGRWSLFFVVITGLSSTARNYWSLSNLLYQMNFSISSLAYIVKKSFIQLTHYQELQLMLRNSEIALNNMPEERINELYEEIFKKEESGGLVQTGHSKQQIEKLFGIGVTYSSYQKRAILQGLFAFLGVIIGGVATYSYYDISRKGALTFMKAFNEENTPDAIRFAVFCGVLSLIFRGSLYVYSVSETFAYRLYPALGRICKQHSDCCSCRKGETELGTALIDRENDASNCGENFIFALSIWISFCGSGPLTMMTYDNIDFKQDYAKFIIACAFICAFATKIWAVSGLMEEVFQKKTNKRKKLVKKVSALSKSIFFFKEEAIKSLGVTTRLEM